MIKLGQIIIAIVSIILVSSGSLIIDNGLSYTTNDMPKNPVKEINSYYFYQNEIQTVFSIKAETTGAFMASNPINISVTTNGLNIKGIQLEFLGASQYFPNNTQPLLPTFPPYPPSNLTQQEWSNQYTKNMQQYENAMKQYDNENKEKISDASNAISSNILFLSNDSNIKTYDSFLNETFQNYPTFSGTIQNLTYPVGGKFSIGVTVTSSDGNVNGYGLGNTAYLISNFIEVDPSSTVFQIQSNNILIGLTYVSIGLTILLAGIALIIELVKLYNKNENKGFSVLHGIVC